MLAIDFKEYIVSKYDISLEMEKKREKYLIGARGNSACLLRHALFCAIVTI